MYINRKVLFINENKDNHDQFYCNLCSYPLITMLDFEKSKEYCVCNNCYLEFVESRQEDWKEGWRPEPLKLKEYIKLRKQLDKRINI
jgi:hypothetical protein